MATFQDVIGQEQIVEHLRTAVKTGKVSHAYILQGERSAGKEFIAKIFAAALQCEKQEGEPCGEVNVNVAVRVSVRCRKVGNRALLAAGAA